VFVSFLLGQLKIGYFKVHEYPSGKTVHLTRKMMYKEIVSNLNALRAVAARSGRRERVPYKASSEHSLTWATWAK
jgi:hypothetical protein